MQNKFNRIAYQMELKLCQFSCSDNCYKINVHFSWSWTEAHMFSVQFARWITCFFASPICMCSVRNCSTHLLDLLTTFCDTVMQSLWGSKRYDDRPLSLPPFKFPNCPFYVFSSSHPEIKPDVYSDFSLCWSECSLCFPIIILLWIFFKMIIVSDPVMIILIKFQGAHLVIHRLTLHKAMWWWLRQISPNGSDWNIFFHLTPSELDSFDEISKHWRRD